MQVYHNISWNTNVQLQHLNHLFHHSSLVIAVNWHGGLLCTNFFSLLFLEYVKDVDGKILNVKNKPFQQVSQVWMPQVIFSSPLHPKKRFFWIFKVTRQTCCHYATFSFFSMSLTDGVGVAGHLMLGSSAFCLNV